MVKTTTNKLEKNGRLTKMKKNSNLKAMVGVEDASLWRKQRKKLSRLIKSLS